MSSCSAKVEIAGKLLTVAIVALCVGIGTASAVPAGTTTASPSHRPAGKARDWAHRDRMPHGIAGAEELVFITEPLHGRVVALDRNTGREVGEVTPPSGEGFLLPFTLRVPEEGRLVILDAGGFPDPFVPSIPRIYDVDYTWNKRTRTLTTQLVRTVRFDGLPVVFSEDFEVLPDGSYVMSESVIGGLWIVKPDGTIAPGMVPSTPAPIPEIGACFMPPVTIGGLPFGGMFGPGVGSLTQRDGWVYFSSSCLGGLHRVPTATLLDPTRTGEDKAADVETVSPATRTESLKGLAFDPSNPGSRWLWATDPFQLQLIRIDIHTGEREVVSDDARLFNFAVAASFLPRKGNGQRAELVVSSDQEHRFTGINPNIPADDFTIPFVLTHVNVNPARD